LRAIIRDTSLIHITLYSLNEPAGFISQQVIDVYRQFAYDSYGRVRYPTGNNPSDVYLSLHSAFQPLQVYEKSFPSPEFLGVSLSDHPYFVFNENDLKKNDEQRVASICGMKQYYARADSFNPLLLDEFTAAITDCTNFLNGQSPLSPLFLPLPSTSTISPPSSVVLSTPSIILSSRVAEN